VIIKQIPDQWFIKYSDPELTEKSKEQVKKMNIYPSQYKEEMPKVLDWFDDRACIRRGSWLGTEFPFKKGWIIEPISDSTLYPTYYIISKYVNEGKIRTEEMDDNFFDYVFLNEGGSPEKKKKLWNEIKREFDYWYPVDINLGGKEHKTVHFPVFLMNHVAILPPNKWPNGIFVNWWIIQRGKEKISKSKGGAEPIPGAAKKYGVDPMRLYYAHAGSPYIDIEWDDRAIENYKKRISMIWKMVGELIEVNGKNGKPAAIDNWLKRVIDGRVKEITIAMDGYDLRRAANEAFFEIYNDFQWYLHRGGKNKKAIMDALSKWIRIMAPFTPHIGEELWELIGGKGFVSSAKFPEYEGVDHEEMEIGEKLIGGIIQDVGQILKVTKIEPSLVLFYTSPEWKWKMIEKGMELDKKGKLEMGNLMRESMIVPQIEENAKEASTYGKKLIKSIKKGFEARRIDEFFYLNGAREFLEKEIGARVEIYRGDDPSAPDPGDKKSLAEPLKPAIYICSNSKKK
jgi:leucyl-tRNA synthetase